MSTPPSNADQTSTRLLEPYNYLHKIPGKDFRRLFISSFNQILKAPQDVADSVESLIKKLHTISLLFDDIEDNARLRRGKPAAHCVFGIPRTINAANLALFQTIQEAGRAHPGFEAVIFEELINLHEGQGLELFWRDVNVCPTEEEYLVMASNKTGGMYRLAVRLLQLEAACPVDLTRVADTMGLIYQIRDDLLNLMSETYAKNKGFAEDISEGKFSFPIVHALASKSEETDELRSILLLRTTDCEIKREAVNIIERAGGLEYTKKYVQQLSARGVKEIEMLDIDDATPLLDLIKALSAV